MKPIIYPYKLASRSAKALATALGTKRVRPDGKYVPKDNHLIINWGTSTVPNWDKGVPDLMNLWLNNPWVVDTASNKLKAFKDMQEVGVSIPEFTTDVEDTVQEWVASGSIVVGRKLLRGNGGKGIVLIDKDNWDNDVDEGCKLYVKYIKKQDEYRIHVFRDKVIDRQQKKKKADLPKEEVNFQIRNHSNGWVFCRDGVSPPESVEAEAIKAVKALGLDFGAVDVIWNNHHSKAYVLEVNTAPGLEGTTLVKYVDAIKELL